MTHELSQNKSTNNKHLKLCNKFHIIKSSTILEVCGPVNLYGDLYVDHWAFAETEFSRLGILDLISDLSHMSGVDQPNHHILRLAVYLHSDVAL